jgi:hypothetical protein
VSTCVFCAVAESLANRRCLRVSHTDTRTVAHRDGQPISLKKYGLVVTCLISFIFRCSEGWEGGYSIDLTPGQKEACKRLKEILGELSASSVQEGMTLTCFDHDELEDLEDLEGEDELWNLKRIKARKHKQAHRTWWRILCNDAFWTCSSRYSPTFPRVQMTNFTPQFTGSSSFSH